MTDQELNWIKASAREPSIQELVNLQPDFRTSWLLDFCTQMFPNGSKIAQGNVCHVYKGSTSLPSC